MNKLITKLTLTLGAMVVVNEMEVRTNKYEKNAELIADVTKYIGADADITAEDLELRKEDHKFIAQVAGSALVGAALGTLISIVVDKMVD